MCYRLQALVQKSCASVYMVRTHSLYCKTTINVNLVGNTDRVVFAENCGYVAAAVAVAVIAYRVQGKNTQFVLKKTTINLNRVVNTDCVFLQKRVLLLNEVKRVLCCC